MLNKIKLFFKYLFSNLNIYLDGDYSEHMPKGTPSERISQYWKNSFNYLDQAIKKYNKEHSKDVNNKK